MGAGISILNAKRDIVNESFVEILTSQTAICRNSVNGTQKINISNIHGGPGCKIKISGINQESQIVATLNCRTVQQISSAIKNNLETVMNAKAADSGLGFKINVSNEVTSNITKLSTRLQNTQLAECTQNALSQQNINVDNISCGEDGLIDVGEIQQKLNLSAIATCILQQSAVQNIAQEINQKYNEDVSAFTTGASISCICLCCCCCICILLLVYMQYSGSGGGQKVRFT